MTIQRFMLSSIVPAVIFLMAAREAQAQFQLPRGACCTATGSCIVTDSFSCFGALGTFAGAGTTCEGRACSGACCSISGTCAQTGSLGCAGTFHGLGTACADHICTGACCASDGTCADVGAPTCSSTGGTYGGTGTTCAEANCSGACCLPDGSCANTSSDDCTTYGGRFDGLGSSCDTAVCPLGTSFTYQGQLKYAGMPLNELVDLQFSLWDSPSGGNPIGTTFDAAGVEVTRGLFDVRVDFGVEVFNGRSLWLEVAVCAPSGQCGQSTTLSPRQPLTATPYALQTRGIFVDDDGLVGIGTSRPEARLQIEGGTDASLTKTGFLQLGPTDKHNLALDANEVMARQNGQVAPLYLNHHGGNVVVSGAGDGRLGVGTNNPQVRLHVAGTMRSDVVEIVGGSDIAEPYVVHPAGEVAPRPGMVVVIDRDRVGELRVARRTHDRSVAGIISGANGILPGLTLRQEGTIADGALPVATAGRVWCLADADANGPIRPGDLLTTSATPGHAMRADQTGAQTGAVLGKAMSTLESGKGMVFVLVSLQ